MLLCSGALHVFVPESAEHRAAEALCFDTGCVSSSPCGATDPCDAAAPDERQSETPAHHEHEHRHEHLCVVCQFHRSAVDCAPTTAPILAQGVVEFIAPAFREVAPEAARPRQASPRAPPVC